jgi:hypothetical protein
MSAILASLVLIGALSAPGERAVTAGGKPWTILPVGESESALMQCSRTSPGPSAPFWSPASAQVEELEKRLPAYLRQQKHAAHADKLASYLRQYAGFTRKGRKLIYLNAFPTNVVDMLCHEDVKASQGDCRNHWRIEGIFVCDGGDDFWGVEYDPESKTFSGLDFNGSA